MSRQQQQRHDAVLSERIADCIWEIWRVSKAASHPVRVGEVTPEQFWILRLLDSSGPQRIKDIAADLGTTPSPVTISVKRLERDGLLRRERGTEDERVVTVSLTKKGKNQFEVWRQRRRRTLSTIFDCLTEEEKESLERLLQKVARGRYSTEAEPIT